MKNKPIIGIVSKHYVRNKIRPDMYIRDEIKQVIFDNGGMAIGILLPKDEIKYVQDNWENGEKYIKMIIFYLNKLI